MEKPIEAYTESTPLINQKLGTKEAFYTFLRSFRELAQSPRDIWLLYIYELFAYGALCMIVVSLSLYFTKILGFSDIVAGYIIASFGLSGVISSLCLGQFIDRYGIKWSLLLSNLLGFMMFILLFISNNTVVEILVLFIFCSTSFALNIPTVKLAVKYYTLTTTRSLGYSFLFISFFAGSGLAGIIVDFILTLFGTEKATFKIIFIIGACIFVIATTIGLRLRQLDYEDSGENEVDLSQRNLDGWKHTKECMVLKSFWRFFVLALLLVIIKAVYMYIFIVLPIYMYREIGEGAHFGYILAINKLIMIISIPSCTILVYYFSHYTLLAIGGFISSLSFIPLLFGGSYLTVIAFIVIVSIGESIYSPRLIDYTLQITPKGREGVFLAVAASPIVLSVILAGLMSGFLLDTYCPENGDRECWKMWSISGFMTILVPFFMIIFRSCLEQPENEEDPYMPCMGSTEMNSDDEIN
ncbi:unnamed protein product [Blepharisma stoltei]|uniref:Major facilitator superfamily (MFS) profile domain-containing protein n=1 Tax=Blepharisma stoltei TaxID=1481888 RepID=A0AAU9K808_9CILI|nr:unnamed protein product [Blepharisma stoltei]